MTPHAGGVPKDLTLAEFRQFRDYIHQHSGIFLEESKRDSLRISLVARATRASSEDWDLYFELLSHDEAEFRELLNLIVINETSFFRFPGQFEVLASRVLPEIARERESDSRLIRMWSAGCSTGEEPYTIAMTWVDSGLEQQGWRAEIHGTDVSTKALAIARAGLYPVRALLNVPDEIVRRHFVEVDGSYRIAQHVRRLVEFSYQNLIKEPYPLAFSGGLDVIFCRNVTIYFKLESTKRVVANLFNALNDGGYLFIGHSETLSAISDEFELVELDGIFVYRKPHRGGTPRSAAPPSHPAKREPAPAARPRSRDAGAGTSAPARATPRPLEVARAAAASARTAGSESPRPADAPQASTAPERAETADVQPSLEAARALMAEGKTKEALATVEGVLARNKNDAGAQLIAAQIHADAGDLERATAACLTALSIDPLLPGARYILGLIHVRQGDLIRAVSELKKTVYIDKDFALAHLALANIYKGEGNMRDACREYDNALRALNADPEGEWTRYVGGWKADVILRTCERSLIECRKVMGTAR